MLTPSRAHGSDRYLAGISAALSGMSLMWPMLDSTTYPGPRYPAMVRALAGDSTITSRVPWLAGRAAAPEVLAGTLFNLTSGGKALLCVASGDATTPALVRCPPSC